MLKYLFPAALAEDAGAAQDAPSWLSAAFGKFAEFEATTWIALLVLAALFVILLVVGRKKWTARMIAYAALSIALSFVLSYIRLYRMPQGGSVTAASMLPVMLFSAAFGVGPGLLAGLVYGVLQYLQGGYFLNVWQVLLDYVLAYAALGLAGLYKRIPGKFSLYAAMTIAAAARLVSATLAGYMFWDTALWASVVYNGSYLLPDLIICIALAIPVAPRVLKVMRSR